MSYLNNLRLVFAGEFQADVSTVNNDVRHFDDATFEERFQEFQDRKVMNGWWNPVGSGAFRLINCKVTAVYYSDGTRSTTDPIVGLFISGSNNRVGGKIVDLDPQWQQASALWGLRVRLSASGDNSPNLFSGAFEPAPFRDLWFSRQERGGGDGAASALFQSVLTSIDWSDDLLNSRFLQELQAATAEELLSMRISTFSFNGNVNSDTFTLGTVVGAIGPYLAGEPHSFILGRRMYQTVDPNTLSPPANSLYFFDCSVDETTSSVFADLSNTLPLDKYGNPVNLGNLQLAVLASENIQLSQQVTKNQDFTPLGGYIPYTDTDWLTQTSGIWAVALSTDELSLVSQRPLAIIQMSDDNTGVVAIRETLNGWLIRAENFIHRVEPGETFNATLFAACYGKPFANATVLFSLRPPMSGQGGGPDDDPDPPKAPIPDINIPAEAVSFEPTATTNAAGQVELSVSTTNPNNPRGYLDGQVYLIQYQLEHQADGQQQTWDYIIFLLHDEYQVPEQPSWCEHIQPILQQYSNLYPIMSKRLVNLSNYESVKEHRAILELAFSLDMGDPNYMPVTRDLSRPKQETILKWLRQKAADGSYVLFYGEEKPETRTAQVPEVIKSRQPKDAATEVPTEPIGAKTQFAKNFSAALKAIEDRA
ncbi:MULTISPECIES: hypothetical protein [unclassified Microcoleus]|uniref:hypothetical protein n=1 Tax=unclassified Microcoleus TaxID=2642155 RepID=UPI002FD59D1A